MPPAKKPPAAVFELRRQLMRCCEMERSFKVGLLVLASILGTSAAQTARPLPYLNTSLSKEQRAADLVGRMTLEEKVGQMGNAALAIPRLNVPAYDYWNEALH